MIGEKKKSNFDDILAYDKDIEKISKQFQKKIMNDIDFSKKYPQSLTNKGEIYLRDPVFWILLIRMKLHCTELNEKQKILIKLMNKATCYEIFNRSILFDFFIETIMEVSGQKGYEEIDKNLSEIKRALKRTNGLEYTDYMYLLKNKKFFYDENEKTNFFIENQNCSPTTDSSNNNNNERKEICKNNNSIFTPNHKNTLLGNLDSPFVYKDNSPNLLNKKRNRVSLPNKSVHH